MKTFHLLALSGSLRAAFLNAAMLRMAQTCAPPDMQVCLYDALGCLPLFNPDLEAEEPLVVMQLRIAIQQADAALREPHHGDVRPAGVGHRSDPADPIA